MSKMEKVDISADPRLFRLISDDLYKNDLVLLRELIQNSKDAKANKITVKVEKDKGKIIVEDNGEGMSYNFLKNDFKKIGKSFKDTKGDIGIYGIGRCSVWKIADSVRIFTLNNLIDWKDLGRYYLSKTDGDSFIDGTKYEIKVKPEKRNALNFWDVKRYIQSNIILKLPIEIVLVEKGQEIRRLRAKNRADSYEFRIELGEATVYLSKPDDWSKIKIFEKGLKVKTQYQSNVEALINYHKRIKTLSRDNIKLKNKDIKNLIRIALSFTTSDLETKELKPLKDTITYIASLFGDKDLAKEIPIKNRRLKDFKNFYYSKAGILVKKAIERGYKVLVVDEKELLECCKLVGLTPLKVLKDELKEIYFHKKADKEKGKAFLKNGAHFLDYLVEVTKDLEEKQKEERKSYKRGKEVKTTNLDELEDDFRRKFEEEATSDLQEIEEEEGHDEITFLHGNIGFGEKDDAKTVAWNVGNKIALNLNNELVKTALEQNRPELLEDALLEEFVHRLGYLTHNKDFHNAFTTLKYQIMKNRAEETAVFTKKALVSLISGKYRQGQVKLPKKVMEALEIEKGDVLKVQIENLE